MLKMKHTLMTTMLFVAMGNAYAADMPQSATLKYSGSLGIPATMTFKRNGDNYTVVANINVPMYKISFQSGGKVVDSTLQPTYFRDVRNGKLYSSAKFVDGRAIYGKAGSQLKNQAVSGSVMDLFTLSWHLAFNDGRLPSRLSITNGNTLIKVSGLNHIGSTMAKVGGGMTRVNQFNVKHGGSGEVYYAFVPELNNVPAVIKYYDGEKDYHLTLKSVVIDGKVVKP